MTPAASLLDRARFLGVLVEPQGPKLHLVAPPALPDREWTAIVEGMGYFKAEVLALLAGPSPTILRFPALADPAPKPWRAIVATWLIPRRQRWADRTAALEDAGLGWRASERQAFDEITATPAHPTHPIGVR